MDGARESVTELWRCGQGDLVDLLESSHRLVSQANAVHLAVVAEVTERKVAEDLGAINTAALLRARLNLSPKAAREADKLAAAFTGAHPDTGAALAAGRICLEQATAIIDVLTALPEVATAAHLVFAEQFLLDKAQELNARDLRRLAAALVDAIDPDGAEPREDLARGKRAAFFRDNRDGTQTLTWTDTHESMALAKAAIEALSAPLPGVDGTADPRCAAERRADALLDLCARALRSGELPGARGVKPHLHITMSAETLHGKDGAPAASTSTGERLSPEAVRRIACDADLTPIILDGHGVPLFVGRTSRTVTPGQWAALVVRDGGCVFPSCTRPAAWCTAHHGIHWIDDGLTDLDNLYLLCSAHHVTVHHGGWAIRMGPQGHPELIPPPWVDPYGAPRRNEHWRTQRELLHQLRNPDP